LLNPITISSLLILVLPLITFGILYFFGNKLPRKGDWLATGLMGICFVLSVYVFTQTWNGQDYSLLFQWFQLSGLVKDIPFTISISVNSLSALMLMVVTLISFLVHLYSIEYMFDKKNYTRYFPYLGLFSSSMIGIVLSDNLLVTFMCWEIVGFASYLLIGFWTEKQAAARAAKKAFLINRIGDAGFMVGLFVIYLKFGTFDLTTINEVVRQQGLGTDILYTIAGIGIFLGCVGKSAQFPLQLWLPDAMEGPTPASALIHAATMVAAGIYLLAKTYLLLTVDTLTIIAFVGAITAIMGAIPAVAQTDIKKVLAFSTISQLGFMVMAMGVGAYDAAIFHLVTHAFFKACLFLTAGAVIHEMHHVKRSMFIRGYFNNFDTLNMKLMGGLRSKMPVTFIAYLFSSLALIGVPLFSGFLSKDAILEGSFNWALNWQQQTGSAVYFIVPVTALLTIAITAYYMIRQMILVFFGTFKLNVFYPEAAAGFEKIHDPGWLMKLPMLVPAILSLWFFYSWNPFESHHSWVMEPIYKTGLISLIPVWLVITLSLLSVTAGALVAWMRFRPSVYAIMEDSESSFLKKLFKNNWYLDRVYMSFLVKPGMRMSAVSSKIDIKVIDGSIHTIAYIGVLFAYFIALFDKYIVDGIVNVGARLTMFIGNVTRKFQQGTVHGYFAYAIVVLVLAFIGLLLY